MRGLIRGLLLTNVFVWTLTLGLAAQESNIKFCDNSGAPNKKNEVHRCACQQTTGECDKKPETNMPGCSTNCRPDACKCKPKECS